MNYRIGTIGRVILARLDHGEAVVPALEDLCGRERIASGWIFLFGAVAAGKLVVGPRGSTLPPDPVWEAFREPREIVGLGSVALRNGRPAVHLHASLGRGRDVLTGCIRREGDAFIVVEAMVIETSGIAASRQPDAATGLELLTLE